MNGGTSGANAANSTPAWQSVSVVPGPAADGSNQLKLYDAGSPLLPSGLSLQNVATQNNTARNGGWRARIDADGGVWMWVETGEATESEDDEETTGGSGQSKVNGLPPVGTLALGGGHAVALTQDGEVWAWETASGTYPGGAASPSQPVKLAGLPEVVSIGAWREYGFAKGGDGAIWLWQGIENKYAALTDEELAAAIGILTGNTPPQNTPQPSFAPKAARMLMSGAMMQSSAAPAPLAPPTDGLRLWLKADAGVVTGTDGKISQWTDQSGLNNHATQGSAAYRPEVAAETLNGLPVVKFTASTNQWMQFGNVMSGATQGEIFVLVKAAQATPGTHRGLWWFGGAGGATHYPASNGSVVDDFGSNAAKTAGAPPDITQWHIYNVSSKAGDWESRVNGKTHYRTTTNNVSFYTAPYLGRTNQGYAFDGDIAEVIIYDRVLDEEEREAVGTYLYSQYTLAGVEAPDAPANLAARPISPAQAGLTWEAEAASSAITYVVERKDTTSETYEIVARVKEGRSYVDSGLDAGTSYVYRIKATSYAGASGYSNEASVTLPTHGTAMPMNGMRAWLRADAQTLGVLGHWADQSGHSNGANQGTASNQPLVVSGSSGLNGWPVVRFEAAKNQWMQFGNVMSGAAEGEIFVLVKAGQATPGTHRGLWWFGGAGGATHYPASSGSVVDDFGSNAAKTAGAPPDITQWHIYNVSSKAGDWESRVNGKTHYRTTSNSVYFYTAPYLGRTNQGYAFDGDIAEVIIYDRVLGEGEREAVGMYLNSKYTLAGIEPPDAPENLAARGISATQAGLTWQAESTSSAITYVIERRDETGGTYEVVARIKDGRSYVDSGLEPGASYIYRVKAVSYTGASDYSDEAPVTLPAHGVAMPTEGMRAWLRADAQTLGVLGYWADQSGHGNGANQGSAANQPEVVDGDLNGWPVVRFEAAKNQWMQFGNVMSGAAEGEIFVLVKAGQATPGTHRGLWWFGGAGGATHYPASSGSVVDDFGSNAAKTAGAPPDITQWHIYNVSSKAGDWESRVNGKTHYRTTSNSVYFYTAPYLGRTNQGYVFDGDIAEVIIYDHVLEEEERNTVGTYLHSKYTLAGVEPPGTPANLAARAIGATQVGLTWEAEAGAGAITYVIERRDAAGGAYEEMGRVKEGRSHVDSGLEAGSSYVYRVKAVSYAGESDYSNEASVTLPEHGAAMPVDGMRAWLRADAQTLGVLGHWADQSGHGNGANQGSASNQPLVISGSSDLNGWPVVRFNASANQWMQFSNVMGGATEGEIFVLVKAAQASPGSHRGLWWFGGAGYATHYPASNGSIVDDFGSNVAKTAGAPPDITQWHIYNVSSKAGHWESRVNGKTHYRVTSNTVSFYSAPYLGRSHQGYAFDGDIAEVLVFDRVLDEGERQAAGMYLYSKYTLPGIEPPAAPPVLAGQSAGAGQNYLSWDAPAETAWTEYVLERSPDGSVWNEAGRFGIGARGHLDQGLAAGAYHYRLKMRNWAGESGYGNTVTLSVAEDSAGVVPVEGMRLWLRADLGVTADAAGTVSQWADISGSNNHAAQTAAASRPALAAASTPDARPVVRFTRASQQKLDLPASFMTGAAAGDVFVILKNNALKPASYSGLWRVGTATGYYPQTNGTLTDGFGSNTARDLGTAQVDITQRHLLEISAVSGSWVSRLNGLGQTRADTNTVSWNTAPLLGHNGSYAFDGDIEEVIIYDRVLTDTEREQVRLHLNARHGLVTAAPETPADLQARPGVQGGVELTWDASAAPPSVWHEYIIERSAGNGDFEEIARTEWHDFTDTGAQPGVAYTYRAKARNWHGESGYATTATPLTITTDDALPAVPAPENLRLWLRADHGVFIHTGTAAETRVQRWQDQSGSGNHAVQLAPANQPLRATDAVTGAPVLRFTAAQKHSLAFLDVMRGATAAEFIVRVKTGATTYAADNSLWKWSSYGAAYPASTGDLTDGTASNANQLQGAPVLPLNQWRTYSVSAAQGNWTSRINGLIQYQIATNAPSFVTAPQLGTNGGTWFDGDVSEILIFDRVLTDAEREQLTRYLEARANPDATPQPPAPPAAPIGLTAAAESATTIAVRWTPPAALETGMAVILERSIGNTNAFEEIRRFALGYENRSDYADRNLTPGTTCAYRLKFRDTAGRESAYSATATVTTPADTAADSIWPADIAPQNLHLWMRADLGLVTAPGGRIVSWEDQSGKNNHAAQTLVANQPLVGDSPDTPRSTTVAFNGAQPQYLALPSTLFTSAATGDVFVVLKTATTTPAATRSLWQFGPSTSYYPQNNDTLTESLGTSTVRPLGQPLAATTAWHLYNVTARPGEWIARLNGLEQYRDATANTVSFSGIPRLGAGTAYFHGDIAELIVFDRVLTTTERERLTRYFNSRCAALPEPAAAPETPHTLDATPDSPSSALVTWTLPDAPPIGVTYTLERRTGGAGASGDFAAVFSFAHGNAMSGDFTDATVAAGHIYTYRFRARDAIGRETISTSTATVTIPTSAAPGVLTQTEGLRLWLRADRGLVSDTTGRLAVWRDQSGQNNHATQAVLASQPALAPTGAILFSGSAANQYFALPTALMTGATSGEVFVILKSNTTASATRGLWQMGYSSYSYYPNSDGTLSDNFGSNTQRQLGAPKADFSQKHLYHVTAKPGEWVARLNDIEQFRATTNTVSWNTAPLIGSNGSYGFDGEITEVLIYDHALTDAERATVRAYLDERHALGITAPPPAPALAAREVVPTGVELSWTLPPLNTDAQLVLQRRDDNGAYAALATLGKHDRAHTDSTVQTGHTYAYRIKIAAAIAGDGEWSNEVTITTTTAPAPSTLTDGLRLWLRAGQQVTIAGNGRVSCWEDQSGQNNHATQTNVAAMPALAADGTVTFTAAQNRRFALPAALMSSTTEGEIFIILKAAATPSAIRGLWRMGYSSYSYYPNTDGTVYDDAGTNTSRSLGLPTADLVQWHLYNISSKPDEWVSRFNGQERASFDTNTVRWSTSPLLGSNGSNGFDGDIAEILIYNRVLSASERETVSNYLARKHIPAAGAQPDAPAQLSARVIGDGQATLEWQNQPATWTWQELQRKAGDGTYAAIARPAGTSHVDAGLEPGQTYTYRIRTHTPADASAWSNEAAITIPAETETTGPAIPLSALRLWLKADTLQTGKIVLWRDQSGKGSHAAAPSIIYAPQAATDATGKKSAYFAAAQNQRLALPNLMNGATEGEVFIVLKTESTKPSSMRGLWRMGHSNSSYYPNTDGTLADHFGASTSRSLATPLADITQWHVFNVSSEAGEWIARINGAMQHRAISNTVTWNTSPLLGSNGIYYFDGDIAEVLVFDEVLSEAERVTVQDYLVGRHRLAGTNGTLAAPGSLTVHAFNETQASLKWEAEPAAWITYEVQRKTGGGDYTIITAANGLSCIDSNLESGTEYTYRVRARSTIAASEWSEEVTVTMPAATGDAAAMPMENLRLWLKADLLATGTLGVWHDQSGCLNDAAVSIPSYAPAVTQAEDGNKSVHFEATKSQHLTLPHFMNGATEGEVFIVLKAAAATPSAARGLWRMGSSNNYSYYPQTNGTPYEDFGTNTQRNLGTPTANIAQWHVFNVSSKAGEWVARLNGAMQHRTTSNTVSWSTSPRLGSNGSHYFDGDIAEVLVFDKVLSSAERKTVQDYLVGKHQLAGAGDMLAAPENLTAQTLGATQASLKWNAEPSTWTGYEVQRKEGDDDYTTVGIVSGLSHFDNALEAEREYTYRVRARSATAVSEWSNEATITAVSDSSGALLPVENLRLWLKADTLLPGTLGAWADQSGNLNGAVAPAPVNAPLVTQDESDGIAVHFDATKNQHLGLPNFMNGAAEGEAFVVLKASSAQPSASRGLWRMGSSSYNYYPHTNGTLYEDFGTNTQRSLGAPAANIAQWHVYNVSSKAEEWMARINGTQQIHSASNTVYWHSSPLLGSTGSRGFDGDIAEVLVFDKVLTAAERATVQNYLAGKHRLAGTDDTLASPENLTARVLGATQASLKWNAVPSAWVAYEIQRRTSGGGYATITTASGLSHLDSTLEAETEYTYRVRARSATAVSEWSNEATITAVSDSSGALLPVESLRLWLKADTLLPGTLGAWADQSGNLNGAVAPAPVNAPLVTQDESGGIAVHFDATKNQHLGLPNFMNGATEGEAFVVLKASSAQPSASRGLWRVGSSSYNYYPHTNGTLYEDFGTNTQRSLATPAINITQWHVYNVSSKAGEWMARIDGTQQAYSTSNTAYWHSAPLLGSNGNHGFDGGVAEVLVFDKVLSEEERAIVNNYLVLKNTLDGGVSLSGEITLSVTLQSSSKARLAWTGFPYSWIDYTVERQNNDGTWTPLFSKRDSFTYMDTVGGLSQTYRYRIRARNLHGAILYSNEATITTPGLDVFVPIGGENFSIGGSGLTFLDVSAGAEYAFSVSSAGDYRCDLVVSPVFHKNVFGPIQLDIWMDDIWIGRHTVTSTAQYQNLSQFFHLAVPGVHRIRFHQLSSSLQRTLQINNLEITPVTVSELPQTQRDTIASLCGMDAQGAVQSKVSPYCLEGGEWMPGDLQLSIAGEPVQVLPQLRGRWYANIPLVPETAVSVSANFAQGLTDENCAITWVPTNILTDTAPFILRRHDRLLLTACEEATPSDAAVTLAITTPAGITETLTTTVAAPLEYCFAEAGVYQITATLSETGNAPVSNTLEVQARAVTLDGGPLVTFTGNYNTPLAVTVDSGPIAMSADAGISGVSASVSSSTTLDIKSTSSAAGRIVARTGAPSGTILGTVAVESPRSFLRPCDWGMMPAVFTLATGEKVVKVTFITDELPDGWYLIMNAFGGGVTALDGSRRTRFEKSDFVSGVLEIYYLTTGTSACHTAILYDDQGRAVMSW
ncbi:hypothetical protein AW736_26520 [Termitidicoccus mucosus]|uniref:Fibronectin type-III domain-containing protein n=2 Tax=Termitidicoccus mucosus TaxID=1184151 RepID=A0A178IQ38_9BACT|nr:hypothetical protein AW736_26520 [Opitutaceae bacterium TSB47]